MKVVVLNLRQKDDISHIATTFSHSHSLSKEDQEHIYSHLRQLKEDWQKLPQHTDDNYPILNLILKEIHAAKNHSLVKEQSSFINHSPSREMIGRGSSKSPEARKQKKVLFKVNVDIGGGRVAKIVVREGDNMKKYKIKL